MHMKQDRRLHVKNLIMNDPETVKVARIYLYACWLCFWFAFFRMKDSTEFHKNLWDIGIYSKPYFYETCIEIPRQVFPNFNK